uniref:Uncharacterized protein n=1 Tax=Rhizophora mucronata TaxID=61149 RepID=A0A2P2NEJ2_RHIMU
MKIKKFYNSKQNYWLILSCLLAVHRHIDHVNLYSIRTRSCILRISADECILCS